MVTCNITVPAGQTLEISPGVQVQFTGHYKFVVNGTLRAIGTGTDSIIFTRAYPTEASKWWGIRFMSANVNSRLEYCRIEYGNGTGSGYDMEGGGVFCYSCSPTISHCLLQNNQCVGGGGGISCDLSNPVIEYCLVQSNTAGYGGGLRFWHSNATVRFCVIVNNSTVSSNGGGGIWWNQSSPVVSNCTVYGNTSVNGGGIYIGGNSSWGYGSATNCIVANSIGEGVRFASATQTAFHFCDVFGNSAGNIANLAQGPPGVGQIDSVNANGDSCDGYSNIFLDPNLVDPAYGDFRLLPNSPCIDAGDPQSAHDIDGSIADIGAYSGPSQGYLALVRPSAPGTALLSWSAGTIECPSSNTEILRLKNFGSQAIVVFQPLEPGSEEFSLSTTCASMFALAPGQMSACSLTLVFDPAIDGSYNDTLLIQSDASNQTDGFVRIPLAGSRVSTPEAPQSVIMISGEDAVLHWDPITQSVGACPVTVARYLVFYAPSGNGPFYYHGWTAGTNYVHQGVVSYASGMFYQMIALAEGARVDNLETGMKMEDVIRRLAGAE